MSENGKTKWQSALDRYGRTLYVLRYEADDAHRVQCFEAAQKTCKEMASQ